MTLLGDTSIDRVAEVLGITASDLTKRRFKMNIELAGTEAYEEDAWSGRDLRIGEAVVRVGGQVPRCVLMTRDPDTARRDYDVLRAILAHRTPMAGGEPPLGVYATVVEPGVIRAGDARRARLTAQIRHTVRRDWRSGRGRICASCWSPRLAPRAQTSASPRRPPATAAS